MANKKNTSIKLNSSIKHIAIENENGEVITELLIDSTDDSVLGRLMDLQDKINELHNGTQEKLKKYNLGDGKEFTREEAREIDRINKESIQGIIDETDIMFGAGTIRNIFADNYKLNPNYVPDLLVLGEFYQQIMPIIGEFFKDKGNKYSTVKGR